jgi:hypothetical protein
MTEVTDIAIAQQQGDTLYRQSFIRQQLASLFF